MLVGRSSVLRMCSVNTFICTVTISAMELGLIVQKSKCKWHNLPGYCLLTEQALKMWSSYSGNNSGVLVLWCCSKALSLVLQHFILYTFFPGHCFNCLQFLSCFMSYVFFNKFQQILLTACSSQLLVCPAHWRSVVSSVLWLPVQRDT